MNRNISSLVKLTEKPTRTILGLMSGTSLDGLDIALCAVSGWGKDTKIRVDKFITLPYDSNFKNEVRSVFSKTQADLQKLTILHAYIGTVHAAMINACLKTWNIKKEMIDLIASHGQTIFHAPKAQHKLETYGNATLQIGDGDHIANHTGIITISDFRQKHIATGEEGAPLAVYGDYLLFSNKIENRVLLNIGGIANFTWLPSLASVSKMFSTDTGPGNTLMDGIVQQHYPNMHFDANAEIALRGIVHQPLLQALKENNFFQQPFPKTTGPELFNPSYLQYAKQVSDSSSLNIEDTLCTLNSFTADTIADAIEKNVNGEANVHIYASGGGTHNPLLMILLKQRLEGCTFHTTEHLGIAPDAKEAVLFALLANECVCGNPSDYDSDIPGLPKISMGKISFPY